MNARDNIVTAMRREEPDYVPFGIQLNLASDTYKESVARTGETDPREA